MPILARSTLGIPIEAARIFTNKASMLPAEGNAPSSGKIAQALNRVLMGGKTMLHNTVRVGNIMGGGALTTSAPTAGQ